jgi:carboxyl-terminal processing protease
VYGGGGITPDIFIPEDTLGVTSYYKEAAMSGLILQFAFTYTDDNRAKLGAITNVKEMETYLKRQNIVEQFVNFADKNGLKRRNLMIQKSYKLLERFVVSRIIYNIHNEQAWTEYLNQNDPVIDETLRLFHSEGAFPQKPMPKTKGKQVAKIADSREIRLLSKMIAHA